MFICAKWTTRLSGPIDMETMTRRINVYRCDLEEGHDGDYRDKVLMTNWKDDDRPSLGLLTYHLKHPDTVEK